MNVKLSVFIAVALLTAAQATGDNLVRPDEQIRLPLAEGWAVGGDEDGFPILLVNDDLSAELQIFRSEIAEDEAIDDSQELHQAVEGIITDVVLTLPEAELLTNTGYHDPGRVRFVLEFVSFDTTALAEIRHRLVGILYRHPDGHQLLFTLWGKTSNPPSEKVAADLENMQQRFEYFGPAVDDVFAAKTDYRFFILGGAIVLLLLILRFWKRTRRTGDTNSAIKEPSANQ